MDKEIKKWSVKWWRSTGEQENKRMKNNGWGDGDNMWQNILYNICDLLYIGEKYLNDMLTL